MFAGSSPVSMPGPYCFTKEKQHCIFPFKYKGRTHHECINEDTGLSHWCATSEKFDGTPTDTKWGVCVSSPTCKFGPFIIPKGINTGNDYTLDLKIIPEVETSSFKKASKDSKSKTDVDTNKENGNQPKKIPANEKKGTAEIEEVKDKNEDKKKESEGSNKHSLSGAKAHKNDLANKKIKKEETADKFVSKEKISNKNNENNGIPNKNSTNESLPQVKESKRDSATKITPKEKAMVKFLAKDRTSQKKTFRKKAETKVKGKKPTQ